jgi:uncharacterized protein (DUF1684 family)
MDDLNTFRDEKNRFFKTDPHSPLSNDQKADFKGLHYFPNNPELRFLLEIDPFENQEIVQMQTSTGDLNEYLKYGLIRFNVEGEKVELTVYTSDHGEAFVPFKDQTSGKDTYGAGRYLELEKHEGNQYLVDFNLAYNPWCAYSPDYSCPIPPRENHLQVPIKAGEMNYHQ